MPRGFLVKRSRRPTPISYRTRCCYPEAGAQGGDPVVPPPTLLPPLHHPLHHHHQPSRPGLASEPPEAAPLSVPAVPRFGTPEGSSSPSEAPLHSPARAVSEERGLPLGSPVSAESFPAPEPLLLGPGGELKLWAVAAAAIATGPPPPPRPPVAPRGPPASSPGVSKRQQGRKVKAVRKLHFEDEVTTSPVLGLRIKEGPPEPASAATGTSAAAQPPQRPVGTAGGGRGAGGGGQPLGEFICQLCKEPYPDPLSLAQHKCSRIVRVEYRCPECDKLFSCPANLASHRRWHKPRPPSGPAAKAKVAAEEPVKAAAAGGGGSGSGTGGSSSERDTPSPGSSGAEPEPGAEEFPCPRCAKRFRRPSALRKHLPTHPEPLDGLAQARQHPELLPEAASHSPLAMPGECHPCPVCGETFSSKSGQERHLRLLHAAQAFPCKYCPATFYSSPGLTRHINKCHPSENRQVVLLQVPVRPAC